MKASKLIGVVVGVAIVLFIIITVTWWVTKNGTKSNLSRNSTKFFVLLESSKIFARPYFATNEPLTEIKITDSPDFYTNFTKEVYNEELTSDCSNKRIYILKTTRTPYYPEQVLDIIQYDDNNNFRRIKRVLNMFNGAISIASDWTTGNIYWTENIDKDTYAIKVTNKLFDKPEYVVQPNITTASMKDIKVYPKKKEIYFLQGSRIFYTSTLPNSTYKFLFNPPNISVPSTELYIDYELDKLCFVDHLSIFTCADIGNPTRPINKQLITSQKIADGPIRLKSLAVSNNAFYWIQISILGDLPSQFPLLYREYVHDTPNKIANVKKSRTLSFFSLNFSCEPIVNPILETTTILT